MADCFPDDDASEEETSAIDSADISEPRGEGHTKTSRVLKEAIFAKTPAATLSPNESHFGRPPEYSRCTAVHYSALQYTVVHYSMVGLATNQSTICEACMRGCIADFMLSCLRQTGD